jgi:hypothetical protein
MPKSNHLAASIVLAMLLGALSGPLFNVAASPLGATSPTLGAAASYSVLAGATVTNTGNTTMPGNLGISPSIGVAPHYTGFPPGVVGPPGAIHDADSNAAAAQAADTAAFGALIAVPNDVCTVNYGAVDQALDGLTLVPGVYCANAFHLAGTLTLSDTSPADVWIFRSDLSTLITTPGAASVVFLNQTGSACNVWWRVASSATIGSGSAFIGNILALTSISMGTGASLNGRALAQTGSVTLDTNTITGGTCLPAVTATPSATATGSATATSTATATGTAAATSTATATGTGAATATNTPVPTATNTPVPAPQNTQVPPATVTPLPAPTETETAPAVVGLPATGGGPLPGGEFPWGQALVAGGLGALGLGLGVGAYRRARRSTR